jgi:hypothetical protein
MKPEGSLSCSQEPSTGPYHESEEFSSNHPHSYFSKIHINIILRSTSKVFLVVSFLLAFPPKSYMHSSSPLCVLHALPIWSGRGQI